MLTYLNAHEVVNKNEAAIVIFTHGIHFTFDPSAGNGQTGNWVLNPDKLENVNKVIVYLRGKNESVNRVFRGDYVDWQDSSEPRRYVIRFSALKEVGTTDSNWFVFGGSGRTPVSFING